MQTFTLENLCVILWKGSPPRYFLHFKIYLFIFIFCMYDGLLILCDAFINCCLPWFFFFILLLSFALVSPLGVWVSVYTVPCLSIPPPPNLRLWYHAFGLITWPHSVVLQVTNLWASCWPYCSAEEGLALRYKHMAHNICNIYCTIVQVVAIKHNVIKRRES